MNEIKHMVLTIDLDIWHPQEKAAMRELDELLFKLKQKELLTHCGNVKLSMRDDCA